MRSCRFPAFHPFPMMFPSSGGLKVSIVYLTLYHMIPAFNNLQERMLLETLWEKEKMLVSSIFSFSHNVFYPIKDRNHQYSNGEFVVCKYFHFGQGQKFVVW